LKTGVFDDFIKQKLLILGYSVQLFEDVTGVRFIEPQCIWAWNPSREGTIFGGCSAIWKAL